MFSKPNKATIAIIGSVGMIVSSTPLFAQARVVASSGGAADSYPEGTTLRKNAILLLARGDKVTILIDNVRRTFPGPGKYPINRAMQERSSVSILDSILNFITGDSAVASGAARGRTSSSTLATVSRDRQAAKARTSAARREGSPPPPPAAASMPPPPEVAYEVPMPGVMSDSMPGAMGSAASTSYDYAPSSSYSYTAPTPALRGRQINDIDIAKSENICLTPRSDLQLWRASADGPESIKIIRQSDNETIELTFRTQEQNVPWPEQFNAAPSGEYAIVNAADEEASLISIVSTGIEAKNLGELAVAYSQHNCAGQMVALETSLKEDGVADANAAIFGTGGL